MSRQKMIPVKQKKKQLLCESFGVVRIELYYGIFSWTRSFNLIGSNIFGMRFLAPNISDVWR